MQENYFTQLQHSIANCHRVTETQRD